VDPAFEVDRLLREATRRGWRVTTIFLTHTHDDHVAGLDEAARRPGRSFAATRSSSRSRAAMLPVPRPGRSPMASGSPLGRGRVQAIHAPGHTPGCVCWFIAEPAALLTGDVLFVGSCGSASDPRAMVDTLQRRIGALPEHTRVYPGHDYGKTPTSSLGLGVRPQPGAAGRHARDLLRLQADPRAALIDYHCRRWRGALGGGL
jgi:hydroxyacylglutathione hydrolase